MQISTRRDIDAAPDAVFAALADFARWERQARASGIEIMRQDAGGGLPAWRIGAELGGVRRRIDARVLRCDAPDRLAGQAESDGLAARINCAVRARTGGGTRVLVTVELQAATLKARLLLHALKLGRVSLERRLDTRLARLAEGVEAAA